jgi:peptide/nickel transport system substrate-binding protein
MMRAMKRSAAALVSMAIMAAMLLACAGPREPAASTSNEPAAAEPKVKRLVMAVPEPGIESNNPRILPQTFTWQIRPIYEHLIGIDPETGKVVPQLATEWNVEPDGKSYRFKLRKGVRFHGTYGEFAAKDVVYTWEDVILPDTIDIKSVVMRTFVDRVEVVNDYEVVFHLNAPRVDFEPIASQAQGGLMMMSKAHFDAVGDPLQYGAPLVGTGPYQFKERAQSAYIRFQRVPYQHWRINPDFEEFEFRFQNEASSRLAGLLTGEAQVASLTSDLLPQAENQGIKVVRGRVQALRTFLASQCCFLNRDTGEYPVHPNSPLLDVRVRKALNKAINRDELNRAFFAGKGEPLYMNHFNSAREGWDPSWATRFPDEYGYDPQRARALLSEAGRTGLRTNMMMRALTMYSGSEDVQEAIAGYWRAVGVDVQLLHIDAGEQTAGQRAFRFDNHFVIVGTSAEQFVGLTVYNTSTGGQYLGAHHPDLHALVARISTELDPGRRGDLYRQAGNIVFEQHLDVPLFWLPAEAAVNPKIVADYVWPGSISGTWSHPEYLKAVK